MKIGLYFGSFNPVHTGHLIIANHIANYSKIDQLWFIISPQNPLKPSVGMLNEYHRLNLVQQAIEGDTQLKASDIEFKLPKPSYTIDTLIFLQEKYPQHTFSVVLGSDSFQNLPKWKNFEILIRDYSFIVYPRPGYEITEDWNADYELVNAPLLDISATAIRRMIKDGKSVRYLLPDKACQEIERNNYYR